LKEVREEQFEPKKAELMKKLKGLAEGLERQRVK
jgi:hypothetical protein